jgi:hypothetical protein
MRYRYVASIIKRDRGYSYNIVTKETRHDLYTESLAATFYERVSDGSIVDTVEHATRLDDIARRNAYRELDIV